MNRSKQVSVIHLLPAGAGLKVARLSHPVVDCGSYYPPDFR